MHATNANSKCFCTHEKQIFYLIFLNCAKLTGIFAHFKCWFGDQTISGFRFVANLGDYITGLISRQTAIKFL